ncbi:hypothetical protein G3I67_13085 [Orrella sp. NBD-18]|uniref:Uncharacterized protein n=1 Tax=Sheuella amnicola TaxID=2707330 RepID=A0A6B2R225_9BURK|nr:hypothetical protein [Sheuella amnicola]NDY84163.1 hypothetical protein [Sheuella amnicola]
MLYFKKLIVLLGLFFLVGSQAVQANTDFEKAIQGRWLSEITEEIPSDADTTNGVMKMIGVDEYLGNGALNMQGQLLMTFNYKNGTQIIASWLINAAGEWQIKNDLIYEKIVDIRAIPDFVKLNGSLLSADDQKNFFQQSGFKIEDLIPKGQTSEDQIISINDKSFGYKTKNDQGNYDVRNKTKTNAGFSTYQIK